MAKATDLHRLLQGSNPCNTLECHFQHGLGDCVNFAHMLPLYQSRGFNVKVSCTPDKAPIFEAGGAETSTTKIFPAIHQWPNPAPGDVPTRHFWKINKGGVNLSSHIPKLLPELITQDEIAYHNLWNEYLNIRLNFSRFCSEEDKNNINNLMGCYKHHKVIVFHPMGNTGGDHKSLSGGQTIGTLVRLIKETDAVIIVLDWDNRVPRFNSWRIRYVNNLNLGELYWLYQCSDLFIGVDSGPLHFTRFSRIPAIGLWLQFTPWAYALPREETIHLIDKTTRPVNRHYRAIWNIVDAPCGISPTNITQLVNRCLSSPVFLPGDPMRDVQLQYWLDYTFGEFQGNIIDRHHSFRLMLDVLRNQANPTMIETGTIRSEEDWAGAGYSTYLFGLFMKYANGVLHSVDINKPYLNFAQAQCVDYDEHVHFHHMKGSEFLQAYPGTLNLFYSDGADVGTPNFEEICLEEVQLAEPKMTPTGMIAIDDTHWENNSWTGKGSLAIPWLLEKGWEIVYSGHQTLLSRQLDEIKLFGLDLPPGSPGLT